MQDNSHDFNLDLEFEPEIDSESEEHEKLRNHLYSLAGDDRSILGRTNDATQWLVLTISNLLDAISTSKDIAQLKTKTKTLMLSATKDFDAKGTTLELKGAEQIIKRFNQTSQNITKALSTKYKDAKNA